MAKGKLIVLEGIDGSGKSAQYRRLCARFDEAGMAYHHIVFPRYDQESSALIRMYLNGAFGTHPSDVNAYAASTFFAVDRYASYRTDWGESYENGGLILSDRYTTSNAIHQGSKLPEAELPAFFDWLYDLEYGKMGLPRPDLVLYLDVDLPTSLKRMQHRQKKLNTKADIHEQDEAYLENCLRIGRLAAAHYGWTVVPFMKDGAERALEEKHEEIFSIVRSRGKVRPASGAAPAACAERSHGQCRVRRCDYDAGARTAGVSGGGADLCLLQRRAGGGHARHSRAGAPPRENGGASGPGGRRADVLRAL